MNLGQLADVLTANARSYRNEKLAIEILPQLRAQPISEDIVRQVIEPYLDQVNPSLDYQLQKVMRYRLEEYVPDAVACVRRNAHMHKAGQTKSLDQDNADALLIGFVNHACLPMDLAFYAEDLLPK